MLTLTMLGDCWRLNKRFRRCPFVPVRSRLSFCRSIGLMKRRLYFVRRCPGDRPLSFKDGLTVELYPAGHLPGAAAAILLTYKTAHRTYSLFYTGDFLLSNSRLVDGLPLEELRGLKTRCADCGRELWDCPLSSSQAARESACRANHAGQWAIASLFFCPLSTLGLGQELLMLLRSHHHFTGTRYRYLGRW